MVKDRKTGRMNAYSIIVTLLPILSVYASGISGFTAGDLILFLASCLYLVKEIKKYEQIKISISVWTAPLLYFIFAIFFTTMVDIVIVDDISLYDVAIRVIRREFYYLTTVFISGAFFKYKQGAELIIKVGIFAAVFLGIQYLFYYMLHIIVTGYIPFLPVYHESYATVDYASLFQLYFRPTSILLEPAHASRYLSIPLAILLFEERWVIKKRYQLATILSIAIVMTTSGTGMIYLVTLWLLLIIRKTVSTVRLGKIRAIYVIGMALFLILLYVLLQTPVVQRTLVRILSSDLSNVNTASGARFRGYIQYFNLPVINKILGMGYGSTPNTELATWFSGASYILYGCGAVGFFSCMYCFFRLFVKASCAVSRALLIIWVIGFFVDDSFMSHVAVTYFSFICLANKHEISMLEQG